MLNAKVGKNSKNATAEKSDILTEKVKKNAEKVVESH